MKKLGWISAIVFGGVIAACSSASRATFDDAVDSGADVETQPTGEEAGSLFSDAAPLEDLSPKGTWTGKVVTPAGDIPVAGALVYLSQKKPDPIPAGNFCDSCVQLDKTVPQAATKVDGTFAITANRSGKQFLVIQKGQFRRVVEIDVQGSDVTLAKKDTILPRAKDAATGDMVPSVLVVDTSYDDIELTLDKLGITTHENLPQASRMSVLKDPARLAKYHIIFLPCGTCATAGPGAFSGPDDALDPVVQRNLKEWVQKGGKLYVTDFEYSFINETWRGYMSFLPNKGCDSSGYDTPSSINDPGLKDWLAGQNHTTFDFENAWIKIDRVNQVQVDDGTGTGTMKVVSPKIWAYGRDGSTNRPMTVSFEDSCGRVLYSAYHTEGTGGSELLPQEKTLMYVLFEVATCIVDPVIPK